MSRATLVDIWRDALGRLDGETLARRALSGVRLEREAWIVALGKVAGPLAAGALEALGGAGRVILAGGPWTPAQAAALDPGAPREVLVGEHPVPGPGSFAAGRRLLELAREARRAHAEVIALVSGGASALVEAPAAGLAPEDLAAVHRALVSGGVPIAEMNRVRRRLSAIKGGGLLRAFGETVRLVLVLADVPSGRAAEVASGPFTEEAATTRGALEVLRARGLVGAVPASVVRFLEADAEAGPAAPAQPETRVLATPEDLARAAEAAAKARGLGRVTRRAAVVTGVGTEALRHEAAAFLGASEGLWIAAGEVDLAVPSRAGPGGRAQHLALEVLASQAGRAAPWAFLAGASDGRDGTDGAGAAVDERVRADAGEIAEALARFESGAFHARHGTRLPGGPPRTNLTDLYLALRG